MSQDLAKQDIYTALGLMWTDRNWGWLDHLPGSGALQQMLRETFTEEEALALTAIPVTEIPLDLVTLDEIAANSSLPQEKLETVLDGIVARGHLYSRLTPAGKKAYTVPRLGYGYPQIYFWKGDAGPLARKIADLQRDPDVSQAAMDLYAGTATKPYRYVPTTEAIDPQWQNVYPSETIEKVILKASRLAVAHCPCRVRYKMVKGEGCGHSTEVCLKLNDLAELVVNAGLAREISHDEALAIIKKADDEGLVHFTDNTAEGINHICNCCGDACWNVRPIRRRQIPRDVIMATYFLRETDEDECIACENCVEICPVAAVKIVDDVARVDPNWCIGCGVCVPRCSNGAIKLVEKTTRPNQTLDFVDLYTRLNVERAAKLETARPG
ncbi:MAG: 4Fe-4S binding protein [Chloroflexi bacterium]|nr:4Fe-4S binding protein [Chloroflexota bacterium]